MVRTTDLHIIDKLADEAKRGSAVVSHRVDAVVLVVDVSGFTALTASLEARHRGRGADILSALMDRLLGSLGKVAEEHGGRVVDLVGDSVLALWVASDDLTIEDARRASLDAALAMIAYSADTTDDVRQTPVRIGVSCGAVDLAMVGGLGDRWELLVVGPAMVAANQACTEAPISGCRFGGDPGWDGLADRAAAERKDDGWWVAYGRATPTPEGGGNTNDSAARIQALSWTAELRPVTVLFCSLVGTDDIAFVSIERIHRLTRVAQEAIVAHGGVIDNYRADDKGVSIVAAFGMLSGGHEAPVEQLSSAAAALHCILAAIDVRDALRDLGNDSAIGITTGKVRVGVRDADGRSRHMIYGNAVNFAARCMQACRNEILCDDATRSLTTDSISFFAPEARKLKGLDDAGQVFGVGGVRQERKSALISDTTPIAGRTEQRAAIAAFVEADQDATARVMIIEGGQGSGKTRMAGFAIEMASRNNRQPLLCRAGLLGTKTPLFAWRDSLADLLRRRARVMDLTLAEAQRQLLLAVGGTEADIGLISPLFGGTGTALSDEPGDADPAAARTLRMAVVAALLGDLPRLIVFEDAHWLDDASIQLVRDLVRRSADIRIIFIARCPVPPVLAKVNPDAVRLDLPDLDREATAALATSLLGPFDKKHPFVDWLYSRSRGNPMFCRALVALLPADAMVEALRAPGAWRKTKADLDLADLPATIEGALLARFGNLPATQLGVLKAASVVGGSFTPETLIALGTPAGREQIEADIAALTDSGILALDANLAQRGWRFADELTREVVYASLPGQFLVELHRRAAEDIEGRLGLSHSASAAQIAQHWLNADMPQRAYPALRRAGQEARKAGAYATAMELWKTALGLLDKRKAGARSKGRFQAAVLNRDLAFVAWRLGEPETTISYCYASMKGLWSGAPETERGWQLMLGRQSLGLLWQIVRPGKGARSATRLASMQDHLRMTNALRLIEAFYYSRGVVPASAIAAYAARIAERTGDAASAARAYGFLGYIAGASRLDRIARWCFARPQRHCIQKRDWSSLAQIMRGEAMYFLTLGQWAMGNRRARFAQTLARKLNAAADPGSIHTMIGMGHLISGNIGAVRRSFDEIEAIAFAKSNDHYLLFAREAIGQVELLEGRLDRAETLLVEAQDLAKRTRDLQSALIVAGLLANVRVQLGHTESVAAQATQLLEQAEATPMVNFGTWYGFGALAEALLGVYASLGPGENNVHKLAAAKAVALLARFAKSYPVGAPRAALLDGQLSALNGDRKRAVRQWEKGVRAAKCCNMYHDLARLHDALSLAPDLDEGTKNAHRQQSQIASAQCGLDVLPPFPTTLPA